MNKLNYMTVEEFLSGNNLKRADVMLSRNKKAFFSRLIMWATKSSWSHAALIFVIPRPESGFDNTFVIESIGDGVDITDLRYYLEEHSKEYDVGIKRLERDWFTNEGEGLAIRKMVRGQMLNSIKAKYDLGKIFDIGKMILGRIIFGVKVRFSGLEKTMEKASKKGRRVPSQFICSGFVQYGYYNAIKGLIVDEKLSEEKLGEVIFNPRFGDGSNENVLLSTSPEDIASTENLKWKYMIRNGKVYEIDSADKIKEIPK